MRPYSHFFDHSFLYNAEVLDLLQLCRIGGYSDRQSANLLSIKFFRLSHSC